MQTALSVIGTDWREIPLTQGKTALVDAEDYKYLSQWQWQAVFKDGAWRARTMKNGSPIYMHRLVYLRHSRENPMFVHNRNGNKLDNRYSNLQSNGTMRIAPTPIVPLGRDLLKEIDTTSRINFLLSQRLKIAFGVREAIALSNQIRTAPVTELAGHLTELTQQLQEILEVMKP